MRATTPPLYYERREGAPVPYHTSLAPTPAAPTLRLPAHTSAWQTYAQPLGSTQIGVGDGAAQPLAGGDFRFSVSSTSSASALGLPGVQTRQNGTVDSLAASGALRQSSTYMRDSANHATAHFVAMETRELSLMAEEVKLSDQVRDLEDKRNQLYEATTHLNTLWNDLLERERRYFMEPVVDLSEQMRELHLERQNLEAKLSYQEDCLRAVQRELQQWDYVVKEKESLEQEISRVREQLMAIERRRKVCKGKAECLFEVESKRADAATRCVRNLDAQLHKMSQDGLASEAQRPVMSSRSNSRDVSLAQKSIIIDVDSDADYDRYSRRRGNSRRDGAEARELMEGTSYLPAQHRDEEDEEEEVYGIGGTSALYSLNDTKRVRIDVPVA
uniref:Uncharacterized protein TCIL3000_8_7500 n=1 Tax=Trypanosoma congolense (strain IL3000) TaxID=1068625 RepID=G0UT08_TRYCI|nr:unnamed protein product [Trypanosoma congolense IL3000]